MPYRILPDYPAISCRLPDIRPNTKKSHWAKTTFHISVRDAIKTTSAKTFVDLDPLFNNNIDEDFDFRASGITRNSFCNIYLLWIQHCAKARDASLPAGRFLLFKSSWLKKIFVGNSVFQGDSRLIGFSYIKMKGFKMKFSEL